MPYFQKTIQLSKLNLNKENPRFPPTESHEMALKTMVESSSDQLLNLAKDIAVNGLNPSEIPIVYMDEESNLTVKDGNRRITALLAITKPNRIPTSNKAYIKRFVNLKAKADVDRLRRVPCIVFDDEDEADRWVQLKHTGENNGVGTVSWNGLMAERFRCHRTKEMSYQLQAYDFVETHADESLKQQLVTDFPITNLGRLISNPNFRKAMGFQLDDGTLKYLIPKEEALRNLTKVVSDLATKTIRVDDIKTTEKMDEYSDSLKKLGYFREVQPISVPQPVLEPKEKLEILPRPEAKTKKELPPTMKRARLIPEECSITIQEPRTNNIYQELKVLNVDRFPNAVSVLFRVFIELSLNRCIQDKGVQNIKTDSELVNKIKRVHDHFVSNGIMRMEDMQGVMVLCNVAGNQPIPMTKQFNGYVHNSSFHPASGDLKTLWDNLQPFIMKLWE